MERKNKIALLKKLQAGENVDEFLPTRKLVFIENKAGIHEVGTGKKFDRPELQQYINQAKKDNPFIKVEPMLIRIRRCKKSTYAD